MSAGRTAILQESSPVCKLCFEDFVVQELSCLPQAEVLRVQQSVRMNRHVQLMLSERAGPDGADPRLPVRSVHIRKTIVQDRMRGHHPSR